MPAIRKAVFSHPKFGTQPPLRLLLIPLSPKEALRQIELERGPTVQNDICKLLGCKLSDSIVLYSEDQIAYVRHFLAHLESVLDGIIFPQAKKKPAGVGIGRMHTSYEAYMDDFALSSQPLNPRASALLHRPNTHGPILVMKTTFYKTRDSFLGKTEDILCWEKVTEADLRGEEFKKMREEWVAVMGKGDLPHVLEFRP
jgi:hypothetical protein